MKGFSSVQDSERTPNILPEAVALLDEWIVAYRQLESQTTRLDLAWQYKVDAAERDAHRLYAQLCDYWLKEATERIANDEASACPF